MEIFRSTRLKVPQQHPNSKMSPQFVFSPSFFKTATGSKKLCDISSGGIPLSRVFTVTHFTKVSSITTGDSAVILCGVFATI